MMCFGLLIMFCQTLTQPAIDSFCSVYQPVIQAKGDGSIQAPTLPKRRMLANELTYKQLCPKGK